MYLAVLDESCNLTHLVDDYISVVWTERFHGYGDFKLVVPGTYANLQEYKLDYYLFTKDTNKLMIIEQVEMETHYGESSTLTITGRSIESVLDRRVLHPYPVNDYTICAKHESTNGIIRDVVKDMTNLLFKVDDSSHPRHVQGFRWYHPWDLPGDILHGRDGNAMDIGSMRLGSNEAIRTSSGSHVENAGVYGEATWDQYIMQGSWYSLMQDITDLNMSGWAIEFADNNPWYWYGYAYLGINRTDSQSTNPPVTFSPSFENLSKGTYLKSKVGTRTKIFSGLQQVHVTSGMEQEYMWQTDVNIQNESVRVGTNGLGLREGYLENPGVMTHNGYLATSANSARTGNTGVDPEAARRQLKDKCDTELWKHMPIQMYEGVAAVNSIYKYREDFFLGDFVQIENEYGQKDVARVTEYVRSSDVNGDTFYPTFSSLSDLQKSKPGLNIK